MAFVISRLCRDCVDQSCVSVCPVDCIVEFRGEDPKREFPNQLYINPDECIDCGVCEPECPWEAIFEAEEVPDIFKDDIALNARTVELPDHFGVPDVVDKPAPSPEQVLANKRKWDASEERDVLELELVVGPDPLASSPGSSGIQCSRAQPGGNVAGS